MRIFDSVEDVKDYFQRQREAAEKTVSELTKLPRPTGPGAQREQLRRTERLAVARAQYSSYTDKEIRPGLIGAFEAGQVKAVLPSGLDEGKE